MLQIPLQAVPSQQIQVVLGGQNCQIAVYQKQVGTAVNTATVRTVQLIGASGSLTAILTFNGAACIPVGTYITFDGQTAYPSLAGQSYYVTASSSGSVTCVVGTGGESLAQQPETGVIEWPGTEGQMFVDLNMNGTDISVGVLALNGTPLTFNYSGFVGQLVLIDTQGESDPTYDGLGSRYQLVYLEAAEWAAILAAGNEVT